MQFRALVSRWTDSTNPIEQIDRAIGFVFILFRTAQTIQTLVVIGIPMRYCRHHLVVLTVVALLVTETAWVVGRVIRRGRYAGLTTAYVEVATIIVAMLAIALDTPADARANSVNWLFAIAQIMIVGCTIVLPLAQLTLTVSIVSFLYAYLSVAMGTQNFPVIFNVGGITFFPIIALVCHVGIRFVRNLGKRLAASEASQVEAAERAARYEERERHGYFLHDSVVQILEQISLRLSDGREGQRSPYEDLVSESRRAARQCRIYLDGHDPLAVQSIDILLEELEEHAASIQVHLYVVDERTDHNIKMESDALTLLNVAARESIRNARKHGDANVITLRVTSQNELLEMAITQQGAGFDLNLIGGATGSANSYYSALSRIGGHVCIDSAPGPDYGVRVRLAIPIPELS